MIKSAQILHAMYARNSHLVIVLEYLRIIMMTPYCIYRLDKHAEFTPPPYCLSVQIYSSQREGQHVTPTRYLTNFHCGPSILNEPSLYLLNDVQPIAQLHLCCHSPCMRVGVYQWPSAPSSECSL